MKTYRAAVIGCSRMGGFIDHETGGHPSIVLPYSHAAGYAACPRTELVACADLREDVMAVFGEQYGIPPGGRYTDYRELLERVRPEIVSIATQPEPRMRIILDAIGAGARAIYAEKALCASVAEAGAIADGVRSSGVAFNLGTNRRWHPGFERMRELIHSGELGSLKTLVAHSTGTLFNTGSHCFDLLQWLNRDAPAEWVQATLINADHGLEGDLLTLDPVGQGTIQFGNGVTAYALNTPRATEFEAGCEKGIVSSLDNSAEFEVRRKVVVHERGWTVMERESLPYTPGSTTLRILEDLVRALDTGEPVRGGADVARANMELIFGFIESHRRGGARVHLPLRDCPVRMDRNPKAHQPRYRPG
jgi:predicted dehydrogenase